MTDTRKELMDEEVEKVAGGAGHQPGQNKGKGGVKGGPGSEPCGIKNGVDIAANNIKSAVDSTRKTRP